MLCLLTFKMVVNIYSGCHSSTIPLTWMKKLKMKWDSSNDEMLCNRASVLFSVLLCSSSCSWYAQVWRVKNNKEILQWIIENNKITKKLKVKQHFIITKPSHHHDDDETWRHHHHQVISLFIDLKILLKYS